MCKSIQYTHRYTQMHTQRERCTDRQTDRQTFIILCSNVVFPWLSSTNCAIMSLQDSVLPAPDSPLEQYIVNDYAQLYRCIRVHTHTHTHTYTRVYTQYARMHTHTIHTYTCAHMHTHTTHTHTHLSITCWMAFSDCWDSLCYYTLIVEVV